MKKKWIRKFLASFVMVASLFSIVACNGGNQTTVIPDGPDYSMYTDQFEFHGRQSLRGSEINIDRETTLDLGKTFITKETMAEYKACGFTYLSIPVDAQFAGPNGSTLYKQILDWAEELDLKVIVRDVGILFMSNDTVQLVGEGCEFATEEALDTYMYENHLKYYFTHPAYYGVSLWDEPKAAVVAGGSYGAVYKSIMRVSEKYGVDTVINANLMGMNFYSVYSKHGEGQFFPELSREEYCQLLNITSKDENGNELEDTLFYERVEDAVNAIPAGSKRTNMQFEIMARRYTKHMETFFEKTGAKIYCFDEYPLYNTGTYSNYYLVHQVVAETAKKYGAEVKYVSQTMTYRPKDSNNDRILSDADLRYLNNVALAFGCRYIEYFTYFNYGADGSGVMIDGGSFLTNFGEKTDIWYSMQKIFAENQKFAPTYFQFNYQASNVYKGSIVKYPDTCLDVAKNYGTLTKVKSVSVDKEHVLINELYDDEKGNYMYAVLNMVDSMYQGSKTYQTTILTFDEQYNYALIWRNGSCEKVALDNHTLTIKNAAGEAAFVMPY